MKQINDLIVVEVPKGSDIEYKIIHDMLCHGTNPFWKRHTQLPPGQYEIIGLYSEVVNDEDKREEVLHYGHAAGLVYTMLLDAGIDWQKLPDTTDLLFIHKLK